MFQFIKELFLGKPRYYLNIKTEKKIYGPYSNAFGYIRNQKMAWTGCREIYHKHARSKYTNIIFATFHHENIIKEIQKYESNLGINSKFELILDYHKNGQYTIPVLIINLDPFYFEDKIREYFITALIISASRWNFTQHSDSEYFYRNYHPYFLRYISGNYKSNNRIRFDGWKDYIDKCIRKGIDPIKAFE